MRISCAVMLPLAVVVVGCASPMPVAKNFDMTRQKVARSAQHWDVVAEDVVEQTLQAIKEKPQLQHRGVYVKPARTTAFNTVFRDFMITHLVNEGVSVSECKIAQADAPGFVVDPDDVEVRYDARVIVHSDDSPDYQPPRLTLLAAGVGVVREIAMAGYGNTAVVTGAALTDWWRGYIAHPTRTELIITTTVVEHNRFVMRTKDIYYIPDGDVRLFSRKVASRSHCPEDAPTAAELKAVDDQLARDEMVERGQRRSNPAWRPRAASVF